MAVSIDTVYQKVLALANKEQRGYITPQEFNLFADMAQKEIFEQYFYDINQWTRQHGNDHGYADMLTNLDEKIGLFEHIAIGDNVTVLNKWGDIWVGNDLPDLYRMGAVEVKYPENASYVQAENVSAKDFRIYSNSPLTKHNRSRPVYLRFTSSSGADKIKIYPYPVEDDGSDFDLSTDEYGTTPVLATSLIHPANSTGRYFHFSITEMNQLVGQTFVTGDVFTLNLYRDGSLLTSNLDIIMFDENNSGSLGANDGYGRINPWGDGTDTDFQVGDTLDVTNRKLQSNKRNVKVDYTRNPSTPKWGYVVVNEKALYNSAQSSNFQLHQSEESELVYKILKLAGISMGKPEVAQAGQGLESAQVSQEKK